MAKTEHEEGPEAGRARTSDAAAAEARPRRTQLQPVDMERDEETMTVLWSDGHRSVHAYDDLRRACPCATCRTEREKAASTRGLRVLPASAPRRASLQDVDWVGRYAFRFRWEDGHDTGIYSFDYLRTLCSCPECAGAG